MTRYKITDTLTGKVDWADSDSLHDALVEMFPGAPDEVRKVQRDLTEKLNRHEYCGEEEAYLGVTVEKI